MISATLPGQTVAHYRILERLGAGGMGIVYKAEDTKLGRTVALKFLPPELTRDEEAKQRFFIEAKAAARLDHPNICTVHEAGETEDGRLYIAMAYYEGEPLDRRIACGRLPVEESIEITLQVADALGVAHRAGIVHRDIKPANIIITSSGTPKILDFGLAKLADVSMTRSRTTVGTSAYMAPEQVAGEKVTPATDVWSLGIVLFEMVTGKRPFAGDYDQAIMYSVLNDAPPLLHDLRPDTPLQLEAVVQKMLMKDPRARYATMAELSSDLRASLAKEETVRVESESRFTPGSIVSGRYRIVSLLGEGGMGAVYRADDLKLGQKIALKYIPPKLTDDAAAFERICGEVRIGRQLSHPNICRVFDIIEAGGHRFVAMEFIDGEDLASLLRRIGRLPPDKALAVTRDIAAGLAAAHDRGIVHRDLKPANVMVDGEGRARITDFGLAAAVAELSGAREFAGTPGYMAPEQLERGEVSAQSDIYALGLIMFEMFTGRQLLDGATLDEIRGQHDSVRRRVSSRSGDFDPAIAQVIARCVERAPAARFASVHAVIASLPGGDAMTAAIAAGETPSPAMIAAAAKTGELSAAAAWGLLAAFVAIIAAVYVSTAHTMLTGIIHDIRSHDALAVRAREVTAAFGHPPSRYVRYVAYATNDAYLSWLRKSGKGDWSRLQKAPPSAYRCTFRTSPIRFAPLNPEGSIRPDDPPENIPGMETLRFDHEGRLITYRRVPEPATAPAVVSWPRAFAQADLDLSRFTETAPAWTPTFGSDQRFAWKGSHAAAPEVPLRVEAATTQGRIVFFRVVEPWDVPASVPSERFLAADAIALMMILVTVFVIFLGRRNIVRRRADLLGGLRLAVTVGVVALVGSVSAAIPVVMPTRIWALAVSLIGGAMFLATVMMLLYVAIEPFVRRRWPQMLIGWSRLLHGQFRNAMIGREVLVGVTVGASLPLLRSLTALLFNTAGWDASTPVNVLTSGSFDTATAILFGFSSPFLVSIVWSLGWVGLLVLLRQIFRKDLAAVSALALVLLIPGLLLAENATRIAASIALVISVFVLYRFGLLALVVLNFTRVVLLETPITYDFGAWYSTRSTIVVLVMTAIAATAFYVSLGGKPLFGGAFAEEEQAGTA